MYVKGLPLARVWDKA